MGGRISLFCRPLTLRTSGFSRFSSKNRHSCESNDDWTASDKPLEQWKKTAGFDRIYGTMAVQKTIGKFTITYYSSVLDPAAFLHSLGEAPVIPGEGRGGIKIVEADGQKLVARKYTHGGLFRAFTGDLFLDRRRAFAEAGIMSLLAGSRISRSRRLSALWWKSGRLPIDSTSSLFLSRGPSTSCAISGHRLERRG